MAVHITNEVHEGIHNGEPYREHERFVSGERSSASVYDDHIYLAALGLPDISLDWDCVEDLREVLDAALTLRHK